MSKNSTHRKKNSQKARNGLWIYGKHAVLSAINNPKRKIKKVIISGDSEIFFEKNIEIIKVTNKEIEGFLPENSVHQGIACEAEPLPEQDIEDIYESRLLVILDQVTDPHNVGAILRSSAAFGAGGVIMPRDNSPNESGVMAKAASGALDIVPLVKVTNLSKTINELKKNGFWCIGLDGEAKTIIKDVPDYKKTVLVLGAEGKGLRRLTAEKCDLLVKLPMTEKVESLNVSNAAAIALYELS